jgi:hypothetical protein
MLRIWRRVLRVILLRVLIIGIVFVRVLSPSVMEHRRRWALHVIRSWHDGGSRTKVAEQSESRSGEVDG